MTAPAAFGTVAHNLNFRPAPDRQPMLDRDHGPDLATPCGWETVPYQATSSDLQTGLDQQQSRLALQQGPGEELCQTGTARQKDVQQGGGVELCQGGRAITALQQEGGEELLCGKGGTPAGLQQPEGASSLTWPLFFAAGPSDLAVLGPHWRPGLPMAGKVAVGGGVCKAGQEALGGEMPTARQGVVAGGPFMPGQGAVAGGAGHSLDFERGRQAAADAGEDAREPGAPVDCVEPGESLGREGWLTLPVVRRVAAQGGRSVTGPAAGAGPAAVAGPAEVAGPDVTAGQPPPGFRVPCFVPSVVAPVWQRLSVPPVGGEVGQEGDGGQEEEELQEREGGGRQDGKEGQEGEVGGRATEPKGAEQGGEAEGSTEGDQQTECRRQGQQSEEGTSRKHKRPRSLSILGRLATMVKGPRTLPTAGDVGAAAEGQHAQARGTGCKRKRPGTLSGDPSDGLKTGAHTLGALQAAGVQLPTLGFFVRSDDEFARRYVPMGQQ